MSGWWQRYLDWFEGEPAWLILFVTVLILTGLVTILEKVVRFSAWIVAFLLVASGALCAVYFIFFW